VGRRAAAGAPARAQRPGSEAARLIVRCLDRPGNPTVSRWFRESHVNKVWRDSD
jgi:hypothetical protein